MAELFQIRGLCHVCICFDYYYFKSVADASGSNVMMRLDQALGGGCVALVEEIERRRCRGSHQAQGRLRGRGSGGGSGGDAQWGGWEAGEKAQAEAQGEMLSGEPQGEMLRGRLGGWGEGWRGGSGGDAQG